MEEVRCVRWKGPSSIKNYSQGSSRVLTFKQKFQGLVEMHGKAITFLGRNFEDEVYKLANDSIKEIGEYAFCASVGNCYKLKEVVIPKGAILDNLPGFYFPWAPQITWAKYK